MNHPGFSNAIDANSTMGMLSLQELRRQMSNAVELVRSKALLTDAFVFTTEEWRRLIENESFTLSARSGHCMRLDGIPVYVEPTAAQAMARVADLIAKGQRVAVFTHSSCGPPAMLEQTPAAQPTCYPSVDARTPRSANSECGDRLEHG